MTHPDSTSKAPRDVALAPLFVAAMFGLLDPGLAAAQSDAPDCVAIVAEMLTPSPSAGTIRASAGCPSSGPVTLANRWSRAGQRSSAERSALIEASSLLRDARIYQAVLGVTRDGNRPLADRLAGIQVLVGYGEGGHSVMQQGEARGAKPAPRPASLVKGSVSFTPDMRSDVKRELYRLAAVDRDPDVRFAAQKASESLGYVVPRKDLGKGRAP